MIDLDPSRDGMDGMQTRRRDSPRLPAPFFSHKIKGQISRKKGQPRPAAAMDDYSDIDVIL